MGSDTSTSTANANPNNAANSTELERKRARDRKSQGAMRERTKWNIEYLTARVQQLSRALELETRARSELYTRFLALSEETDHLRVQKAALQLRLLGGDGQVESGELEKPDTANPTLENMHPYEAIPLNTNPTCLSDEIIQSFVERKREYYMTHRQAPGAEAHRDHESAITSPKYPEKSDLSALFDCRPNRNIDETATVVGDIVRSFQEIDELPKQVALHYIMSTLMKVRQRFCEATPPRV